MSQDNVDRFAAAIEAFNREDREVLFQGMDPKITFEHRLADLQGSLVGVDAVRGWFADADQYLDNARIHCSDFRDLGDERVLALGTVRAIGKESRVATELPFTVVATFRDGVLIDFIDFGDRDQALKAAGLAE